MKTKKRLTARDRRFLELLIEILNFADLNIKHTIKNEKEFYLRNALYLLYLFIREQALGVEILCKRAKASQAISLLRNSFEAFLYSFYISGRSSRKKLALYTLHGLDRQITSLNSFKSLIKKYPFLEGRDDLTKEEILNKGIKEKESMISILRKNYSLRKKDKLPSLEAIAQLCDMSTAKKTSQRQY